MKLYINKIFTYVFLALIFIDRAFAEVAKPEANGLPEFSTKKNLVGSLIQSKTTNPHGFLVNTIAEGIKYVGLLGVISLTIGGIMYMTSYGVDAKTKKAKNVIMYSIIGVLVAILAYSLVDIINSINLK